MTISSKLVIQTQVAGMKEFYIKQRASFIDKSVHLTIDNVTDEPRTAKQTLKVQGQLKLKVHLNLTLYSTDSIDHIYNLSTME